MKPRNQNKILAKSDKTTVVMFVIQLFLLFDYSQAIHDNVCKNSESIVLNNPEPNG